VTQGEALHCQPIRREDSRVEAELLEPRLLGWGFASFPRLGILRTWNFEYHLETFMQCK
jgi:hypothetical protein